MRGGEKGNVFERRPNRIAGYRFRTTHLGGAPARLPEQPMLERVDPAFELFPSQHFGKRAVTLFLVGARQTGCHEREIERAHHLIQRIPLARR
jgi:hypothetical protein